MSDNVVPLILLECGEDFRVPDDKVLEAAKGQDFHRLLVVGQYDNGELYIAGSTNAGEGLILLERAKRQIVFGEE